MRHLCWIGVLALTSACNSILGIGDFDVGPADDVPPFDGNVGDATLCFGTLARFCSDAPPPGPVDLSTTDIDPVFDTATCDTVIQTMASPNGGGEVCVVFGTSIHVGDTFTAIGPRPLMLVAVDTITVDGLLDVSSKLHIRLGAGSDQSCASAPGESKTNGAGGGAGGSFGSTGGSGGPGSAGIGGVSMPGLPTPMVLRGGCAAGRGGDGSGQLSGGEAGAAGGAIYLVAGTQILIATNGGVFASGAGGGAANAVGSRGGGGGGGSGGLVALEAPLIRVDGVIAANGGGGGGGGDAAAGKDGADGSTLLFDQPAIGGAAEGGGKGGPGGDGAALGILAIPGGASPQSGGGGGGGGSVGYVWARGQLSGNQISPPPTRIP